KTTGVDTPGERVPDRRRLFIDLLAHEERVAALLCLRDGPVDLDGPKGNVLSVEVEEGDAVARDRDDPAFIDRHDGRTIDAIRPQERGDVRREHRFPALP